MTQRTVTMKDVARAAGVSVMTVSRAFKADSSVSAAKRAQILKLAEDLGYVMDSTAANLRSQRSDFVAVTIPSLNNANFADTVSAMSEVLEKSGMQILLGYTNYDIQQEERLVAQFLQRKPAAIVVTGGLHTDRTRKLLANAGIPVVQTWDLPADPIGHVVGFSNALSMEPLVAHLHTTGRQRIAFIGGDATGDTRGAERRKGFIQSMTARGLDANRLIPGGQVPISMKEGAAAMATLLSDLPDTDAVICVSDLSAFGALSECARRGIAVPDDIAIAGFGAYEIAGVAHPTITTINPHPRRIGSRTAELLLMTLGKKAIVDTMRFEITPDFVLGGSTASRDDI
ncbi:LacI family DNA-binding transcriptional regulator [Paracoccus sp. JM45]|uniref:LacI family DNA-binding transcriptional regulator n=1 Tax=Paracoccus sp. JM45 TaxID=2283626 RepID=UPI0021045760|nr:LacI family DNA-binding transcriptional regulator [Paracoccus sp. JM45]